MKKASLIFGLTLLSCYQPRLKVSSSKTTLLANGYDKDVLTIEGPSDPPRIEIFGDRTFSRLGPVRRNNNHWEAELNAGVMPGEIQVRISSHKLRVSQSITLKPQITDSASDGTPDFLRLEDESDRQSFRRWMTTLAEIQYFISPEKRPPEIIDCSSLVRYAYREALRDHNAAWLLEAHLPIAPANSSIRKYAFPHTLLGPAIFRTRSGTYSPSDLSDGTFAEFADAKTLREFNMFYVSRDVARAEPGDILFYKRQTTKGPSYHSIIFIGHSSVKPDGEIYVVYHTGPDGTNDGEIRRITLTQLLHFPNTQWQSIAANPLFLGVYRWNILKAIS
jgi:uncharacterized protein YfaT (DUF1175 family)